MENAIFVCWWSINFTQTVCLEPIYSVQFGWLVDRIHSTSLVCTYLCRCFKVWIQFLNFPHAMSYGYLSVICSVYDLVWSSEVKFAKRHTWVTEAGPNMDPFLLIHLVMHLSVITIGVFLSEMKLLPLLFKC